MPLNEIEFRNEFKAAFQFICIEKVAIVCYNTAREVLFLWRSVMGTVKKMSRAVCFIAALIVAASVLMPCSAAQTVNETKYPKTRLSSVTPDAKDDALTPASDEPFLLSKLNGLSKQSDEQKKRFVIRFGVITSVIFIGGAFAIGAAVGTHLKKTGYFTGGIPQANNNKDKDFDKGKKE